MSNEERLTTRERFRAIASRTKQIFTSKKYNKKAEDNKAKNEEQKTPQNSKATSNPDEDFIHDNDWTICDSSADGSTWRPSSPIFSDDDTSCEEWVCVSTPKYNTEDID